MPNFISEEQIEGTIMEKLQRHFGFDREGRQGKPGVFWHSHGAGKSFSMIFYVRKIFRFKEKGTLHEKSRNHDHL